MFLRETPFWILRGLFDLEFGGRNLGFLGGCLVWVEVRQNFSRLAGICACRVGVVSTYALRYRRGSGMYLHSELLEVWSDGHYTFYF